jgi:hypothetical protein
LLRTVRTLLALALFAIPLAVPGPARAAGLKPSEAPLIAIGQHYMGNTAHDINTSNAPVDLWRLPPLLTGDAMTVAWRAESNYPEVPALCLAQDVDDYNWAEYGNRCNGSGRFMVAGNGAARSVITVKAAASAPFLELSGDTCEGCNEAYDFVVESIQHALGVSLTPRLHIRTNAVLTGSANLSNGAPAPDGLVFYLTATWGKTGSAQYTATTSGGQLSFPVALPPETITKSVTFTVTRPADPQYLAAGSAGLPIKVARPKPKRPARKGRHCRRGFKKRIRHGKTLCVKTHPAR